jgi:hypothetical protein
MKLDMLQKSIIMNIPRDLMDFGDHDEARGVDHYIISLSCDDASSDQQDDSKVTTTCHQFICF